MITNILNGKQYIGQTTQTAELRWKGHVKESRRAHLPLYAAIRKYGTASFSISILDMASSQEELNQKEKDFILAYNTVDRNFGYNLHEGGNKPPLLTLEAAAKVGLKLRGRKCPPHVKEAARKANIGNRHCTGRVHSPEAKAKIGAAHKGMKHTPEAIEKIKSARSTQAPIKWSDESKEKYSKLVISLGRKPPSSLGGQAASHQRWHLIRGIINSKCGLCSKSESLPE